MVPAACIPVFASPAFEQESALLHNLPRCGVFICRVAVQAVRVGLRECIIDEELACLRAKTHAGEPLVDLVPNQVGPRAILYRENGALPAELSGILHADRKYRGPGYFFPGDLPRNGFNEWSKITLS